jgi:hypothetical protein
MQIDNCLYVESGVAHKHQVEQAFFSAIKKLGIPCRFKVNFLTQKNPDGTSTYIGFCYVWLSSPLVANALLGKNLDGSPRVEYSLEENEIIPSEKKSEREKNRKFLTESWADMCESEEEDEIKYEKNVSKRNFLLF